MDHDWFAHKLAQPDVRSHSAAALFLASHGVDGYRHVYAILERCKQLDLSKKTFDKCEGILLMSGTRAIAQIVRAVGYDDADQLHRDVLSWIDFLAESQAAEIRAVGIWGLGDLGIPPQCVLTQLIELATGPRLPDDADIFTCRGHAFRMLARVDRATAAKFVDTAACNVYLAATKEWRANLINEYPDNTKLLLELDAESAWLRGGG